MCALDHRERHGVSAAEGLAEKPRPARTSASRRRFQLAPTTLKLLVTKM
jgi:hypothetical protein